MFSSSTCQVVHEPISIQTIRPSSHNKLYNLSFSDLLSPTLYIPLVLFYPNSYIQNSQSELAERSNKLKKFLSETLTQYYPFAGTLKAGAQAVNCHDTGVDFHESQIRCTLSEMLDKHKALDIVVPPGTAWEYSYKRENDGDGASPLVVFQVSYFHCGGMAVAVCLSHKIADACTLSNFVAYWANVTRQSGKQVSPQFDVSPLLDDSIKTPCFDVRNYSRKCITRRFLFPNSSLARLKGVTAESEPADSKLRNTYSRVDVVTALLYKCAVAAAATSNSGTFKPSTLYHAMNLRRVVVPPLPDTYVGNACWSITVPARNENELKLNVLARRINEGKVQLKAKMTKIPDLKEILSKAIQTSDIVVNDIETYACTSFCGYSLYEVDFGWGKPIRVDFPGIPPKNSFILLDAPGGDGIEARVTLTEQDMGAFQNDKDLELFVA